MASTWLIWPVFKPVRNVNISIPGINTSTVHIGWYWYGIALLSYIDINFWVFFNIFIFIFFLLNLIIIIIIIIKIVQPMWVGLDLYDGLTWIEFFLTHHIELGQKIPLT